METIRSPFFYVGDKYKLMLQIQKRMPKDVGDYIEPFVGGGSSFLNAQGRRYILNDINPYMIGLHRELLRYIGKKELLLEKLYQIMDSYGLSCSYRGITAPDSLKASYPKTYYAKYNKAGYEKLKKDFNQDKEDMLRLYILLIYGFNHMIRFNSSGMFNLSVGNVDFNRNVYEALSGYLSFAEGKDIVFSSCDYRTFLSQLFFTEKSYVFFDPPYLISTSEYNKLWDEEKEKELYCTLDTLHKRGIRFGITNLAAHRGKVNQMFSEWAGKYQSYSINSNYISFNDNTVKEGTRELFVTNCGCL